MLINCLFIYESILIIELISLNKINLISFNYYGYYRHQSIVGIIKNASNTI